MTIITYCYVGMIRIARSSRKTLTKQRLSGSMKNQAMLRLREYQLAKTAGKAIMCFLGSWAPYVCIALVGMFSNEAVSLKIKLEDFVKIRFFFIISNVVLFNISYFLFHFNIEINTSTKQN